MVYVFTFSQIHILSYVLGQNMNIEFLQIFFFEVSSAQKKRFSKWLYLIIQTQTVGPICIKFVLWVYFNYLMKHLLFWNNSKFEYISAKTKNLVS